MALHYFYCILLVKAIPKSIQIQVRKINIFLDVRSYRSDGKGVDGGRWSTVSLFLISCSIFALRVSPIILLLDLRSPPGLSGSLSKIISPSSNPSSDLKRLWFPVTLLCRIFIFLWWQCFLFQSHCHQKKKILSVLIKVYHGSQAGHQNYLQCFKKLLMSFGSTPDLS